VTADRALTGGIIAAGEGSRLRRGGFTVAKPLVPVAGVPLIGGVIRNFLAAGIDSLRIIVNEEEQDCLDWVRSSFPALDAEFIVKSTASSLQSFSEVTAAGAGQPMLVSTVDAWCAESDFVRFVQAARRRPPEATVLAVTPLVADEKPLWIDLDIDGRVTSLGGERGALVSAGMYLVPARVLQNPSPPGLGRLREYLAWLWQSGEPLYGEIVERVVDVDRTEDVALAEALATERLETGRQDLPASFVDDDAG
jgi:NDP-sugar pyrophosphorylase family protein